MATNFTQAVTARIVTLMSDRGINPTALAAASGVDRRAIDGALSGQRDWKTSHLEAIAKALNADVATIVSPGTTFKSGSSAGHHTSAAAS